MSKGINRRTFLKSSAVGGLGLMAGTGGMGLMTPRVVRAG